MPITVSLDKMAGAHRSFFPGYKDAHQVYARLFTPDTKLYPSQGNVLSRYSSN